METTCFPAIPLGRPTVKVRCKGKLDNIDTSGEVPIVEISSNYTLQSQEPIEFESTILRPKYKDIDIKGESSIRIEEKTGLLHSYNNSTKFQMTLIDKSGKTMSKNTGMSKIDITINRAE